MNMKNWLRDMIGEGKKKPLPVLSFPSIQLLGISVKELVYSSEKQAEGMAAVAKRCDASAAVSMMDLSVEAECFGANIHITEDEVPTVIGSVLSDPEDAEKLEVPEVGTGRTGLYLDAISLALEKITDRPVVAGVIGPFSLAGRLMDMTEIMINCYDEPEMVHLTLEKVSEFLIKYILAYKARGAQGVVMAEPAAGLLSPALCEEFSSEYVRKIIDAVQDDEFIVIYHNCGSSVARMTDELLMTGALAYHFGNAVNITDMLEKMPADVLVMGNVDPVSAFRNGNPEKMREEVFEALEANHKYPNYLLSSGCDIPPMTPWENIDAFFKASDEYYDNL